MKRTTGTGRTTARTAATRKGAAHGHFLGEGGALAFSPPISRECYDESGSEGGKGDTGN